MTVFNKFARSFKSHWLLYLCVIVFGITNLVASSGAHMVQRLLFFVLTILVHNQYKQLSTMFNFISDMFFNSDPYQTETLLVFSF